VNPLEVPIHIQKRRLRFVNLTELVDKKNGGIITLNEIAVACDLKSTGAASDFVSNLVKNGYVERELIPDGSGGKRYKYKIIREYKEEPTPSNKKSFEMTINRVEDLAKSFVWSQNSDSLRGFVDWLKKTV